MHRQKGFQKMQARADRQKAQAKVDIRALRGTELETAHVERMWQFYQDTCSRKWGRPYLKKGFFDALRGKLREMALVFFAERQGQIVAMALNFQRGQHLYGRYWGCSEDFDSLHFELCYHQPIALCLERGWTRFEAGAQGSHKLKRGLMPKPVHSVHWLKHPGLEAGIRRHVEQESQHIRGEIAFLEKHGPFHRKT